MRLKFVENIIKNITVNNNKEQIKLPVHMLASEKQDNIEKIYQIRIY